MIQICLRTKKNDNDTYVHILKNDNDIHVNFFISLLR